ncbi:MAG TPA: DUF3180 domain-containing protein [Pilimelia sp.]|nr:DUF3180 domain-containing protein [Pilimelia sp.]
MPPLNQPSRGPDLGPARLGPTRPSSLFVAGLSAAAVAWLLISRFYGSFTDLPWLPIVISVALAALEIFLATNTRARIERRPGREPVEPLAVARYVVLAKASSVTGALFAGGYAGVLCWLLVEQARLGPTEARARDLPTAAAGVIAAVALVVAALWLERACRVPDRPDDEPSEPPPR